LPGRSPAACFLSLLPRAACDGESSRLSSDLRRGRKPKKAHGLVATGVWGAEARMPGRQARNATDRLAGWSFNSLSLVWFLSPPIIILSAAEMVVVDGVGGQAVVVMVCGREQWGRCLVSPSRSRAGPCPDSACFHASPGGEGEVWAGMLGSACALPPSLSLSSRDGGRGSRQVVASMRVMDDGWGAARGRAPGHHRARLRAHPFFFSFRRVALAAAPLSLEKSRSIGRKRRIGREEEVMVPFSLLPPRLQEGRPCVRRPSSILRMDADMAGWGLGCTTHG